MKTLRYNGYGKTVEKIKIVTDLEQPIEIPTGVMTEEQAFEKWLAKKIQNCDSIFGYWVGKNGNFNHFKAEVE